MDQQEVRALLERVARGEESIDGAVAALRSLPYEDLGFATLDHHRSFRWGFPGDLLRGQDAGSGGNDCGALGRARAARAGYARQP